MDKFEMEFYTKDSSEKPVRNLIINLDVKMWEQI